MPKENALSLAGATGIARTGLRVIIVATTIAVGLVSGASAQAGGPGGVPHIGSGGRPPDALDRATDVPGHFAQHMPDGHVVEPPMTIPTPNGGPPVFLPGGAGVPPTP